MKIQENLFGTSQLILTAEVPNQPNIYTVRNEIPSYATEQSLAYGMND